MDHGQHVLNKLPHTTHHHTHTLTHMSSPIPLGLSYTIPNLILGHSYDLHIFHAERHSDQSTFAMSTSINFYQGDARKRLDYSRPSVTGKNMDGVCVGPT